jgi:nucleoside-diphosphate-sugar epimerase
VAIRYATSRIVALSTGNVYPLTPTDRAGPSETDPTGPVGEYAMSALARERVLEFFSRRNGTPMAVLRLNYAIEPRYGVLRDIADRVRAGDAVDVSMGWVNVIWQRDANAIALRALCECSSPPLVLNVTGRPAVPVRWLAERFASRWGVEATFSGTEAPTALLSDASRMETMFGQPPAGIEDMIAWVAEWVERGGHSLNKPTHFTSREGNF